MGMLHTASQDKSRNMGKAQTHWPQLRLTRQQRDWLQRAIATLLILPGACLVLLPLWWMISTSLKDPRYIWIFPPQWIPSPVQWNNYLEAIQRQPILLQFRNTMFITMVATAGTLVTTSVVAFGFSRLRFYGRDMLFLVMLATLMLPGEVTTIPLFIFWTKLGLMNTFWPLTLGYWLGAHPFYVFLVRQFIMTIPLELDDAARLDGCGSLRILWYIIVPLIKPALALVTIFSFFSNWNDFFWPLLVLSDSKKYTLSLGLQQFVRAEQYGGTDYHLMMAYATLVAVLPVLVFFLTQKYLIQGVVVRVSKG
jgi:ABC-type glycerol-3-phosphate transport system permease component